MLPVFDVDVDEKSNFEKNAFKFLNSKNQKFKSRFEKINRNSQILLNSNTSKIHKMQRIPKTSEINKKFANFNVF